MTDRPDSSHQQIAVRVDRARAEALRARLHAELDQRGRTNPTPRTTSAEPQEVDVTPSPTPRPARRRIAWAAAAVATIGVAGLVVVATTRDDAGETSSATPSPVGADVESEGSAGAAAETATTPSPSETPTSASTTASTTASTSSTTIAATVVSEDELIAQRSLPSPVPQIYGAGWQSVGGLYPIEMRGDIASEVSECGGFLAAFESPDRPAAVDTEMAWHVDPSALAATYVVVFPTEVPAQAMFDAVSDPQFVRSCVTPYVDHLIEVTGQSSAPLAGQSTFPFFPDTLDENATSATFSDPPAVDVPVDGQWRVQQSYPDTGEIFQTTVVRVGRVVAVVQGITSSTTLEFQPDGSSNVVGAPLTTDAEYESLLRVIVQNIRAALDLSPA